VELTWSKKVIEQGLNQGVGNLVHRYVVVQAGLGFDVDTSAALCLIVAGR
jgi:hypothetical protein